VDGWVRGVVAAPGEADVVCSEGGEEAGDDFGADDAAAEPTSAESAVRVRSHRMSLAASIWIFLIWHEGVGCELETWQEVNSGRWLGHGRQKIHGTWGVGGAGRAG
jgi:hypothetical protein